MNDPDDNDSGVSKRERFAQAYRLLAAQGYRPAAPSDGFGGITVPVAELDLDDEAMRYARAFEAEEDTGAYAAGCTHWDFNRAAVLALEAFRLMNAGLLPDPTLVPRLLRLAAKEYERERREQKGATQRETAG